MLMQVCRYTCVHATAGGGLAHTVIGSQLDVNAICALIKSKNY